MKSANVSQSLTIVLFFLLAEDGIRCGHVTGVQTCALPIFRRIAETAWEVNERTENIGARRLHTLLERLLEDVSFDAGNSDRDEIGRASCRETVEAAVGDESVKIKW